MNARECGGDGNETTYEDRANTRGSNRIAPVRLADAHMYTESITRGVGETSWSAARERRKKNTRGSERRDRRMHTRTPKYHTRKKLDLSRRHGAGATGHGSSVNDKKSKSECSTVVIENLIKTTPVTGRAVPTNGRARKFPSNGLVRGRRGGWRRGAFAASGCRP